MTARLPGFAAGWRNISAGIPASCGLSGSGDDFHGVCRRGDLSGALVSDAGRTAARARLRPAAVAAVEKVGVKPKVYK